MKLSEPTTTITDYILSGVTFFFAILLIRTGALRNQYSILFWGAAFFAIATAALTGGTFHGFHGMPSLLRAGLWKITVFCIGISCLLMLSGTVFATVLSSQRWIFALILANFLVFAAWMVFRNDYKYVVYNSLIAMLGVLALLFYFQPAGTKWILLAVLISFGAAGIQRSSLTLHKHFNHNDLYHVIQIGAMYVFYRGAVLLRDFS
jgi:Family of unknown function (DUF6962)